jgi:poly(A) polymerase
MHYHRLADGASGSGSTMTKDPTHAQKLESVKSVLRALRNAGHEAWLDGGCVRDHLLGEEPSDFDVATSATPDQVEAIFPRSIAVGKAFGVIRVGHRGDWFEVATFRRDGSYLDGRHPSSVSFSSAAEDAARRDFTINGMFWDPVSGEVKDYVGGRADLDRRLVRAIGDPDARLSEDSLRILRAVRFAAKEGFTLDPATRDAVVRHRDRLKSVAAERIREELEKIASGSPESRRRAIVLLDECRLLPIVLPGVARLDGARGAAVTAGVRTPSLPLFLAAILGGSLEAGARPPAWLALARTAGSALRLSGEEQDALCDLLSLRVRARGAPRAGLARRRLLATTPRYAALRELLLAEGGADGAVAALDPEHERLGGVRPKPPLDGNELLALGVPPRKALGRMLKRLQVLALSDRVRTREEASDYVRSRVAARLV